MIVSVHDERIAQIRLIITFGAKAPDLVNSKRDVRDVAVAGLDTVFHKESMAVHVMKNDVFNQQVVGSMNRYTPVVGVGDTCPSRTSPVRSPARCQ